MIDSSRLFIDPEHNKSDAKLNKAWDEIGPEGRTIYKEARDFFESRKKAFDAATLENIKNHLMHSGKGMSEAEAKDLLLAHKMQTREIQNAQMEE